MRPDERRSLKFAAPFMAVAFLGLVTVFLPPYTAPWYEPLVALALLLTSVSLLVLASKRPHRTWLDPASAYLLFPFVGVLRDAGGGGASGLSSLLLVPILWLAITGTRRELWVAAVLAIVTFLVPYLVVGPPHYPVQDWRRAVMWVAIALVIAPVVQGLVWRLDRETRLLHMANARVERLFDDAPHGVVLLDGTGSILRVNSTFAGLIGVPREDATGGRLTDYEPPGGCDIADHLDRLRSGETSTVVSDCTLRHVDGHDVDVALSSRTVPDDMLGDIVMVNVLDISERRRYQDRLAHLVDHDVLTGLANRRRFDSELQRHLERCRRHGPAGAVVLLDLDRFKQVNDTLGHNAGDQLLVSVASVLRRAVRQTDVVARLGGDEFAVLLTDGGQEAAQRVAQHIVDRVSEFAATLDGVRRRVTASVGAVTFAAAKEQAVDILALADMTMYDAKEAGRNRAAVLDEGEGRPPRMSAHLQWESRLEEALEHDRFELHLQPILDLRRNRISSAEVLLRLREEDGEVVPPSRFLYIAERVGLMPRLDSWVVDRSLELLARLREHDPEFQLEVNLSGHSIGNSDVERAIVEALSRHRVDPCALILEITETAAVSDVGLAREFAQRMTQLGCRFALDDFGAGFGSFYYLKHLVFDFVKIDGEFVANSHFSRVDRTILRSIVGIARDLGKQTVAEFVAEPEVLQVVRAEGVDHAQGYMIGKPVPYDDFVASYVRQGD
jgi:diguanylate cyclase (GGDEF)-like protein/PAS domain S-box-containing protein